MQPYRYSKDEEGLCMRTVARWCGRDGRSTDSVEKQRGIGWDREGEIGDRVANAGRVAAPLGGANGTIRSGRWKMEKRVCARTHGGNRKIGATNKPRQ